MLLYNVDIQYLPGKYMHKADYFSRNYIKREDKGDKLSEVVHTLDKVEIKFKNNKESEFIELTKKDEVLGNVLEFTKKGWLMRCNSEGELKYYYKIKNDLIVNNELMYYGMKLLVPKYLRKYVVKKLHGTHMGVSKTVAKAKQLFYWPGMNSKIENFIGNCNLCLVFSNSKVKESIIKHDFSNIPFQKIGMDISEFKNKSYLVIIDYYSRWIEVNKLKFKNTSEIIQKVKKVFSRFGIPEIIVADNNPFGSYEFKLFATEWGINIVNSSPNFPRSNGLAEKAVGIDKKMFKKKTEENGDLSSYYIGVELLVELFICINKYPVSTK